MLGCGTTHQGFEGPPRSDSETARLVARHGKFLAFDGEEIFSSRIRALPGEHAARIRFLLIGDEIVEGVREEDRARLVCESHFEVVAGRDYRFEVRLPRAVQTRGSVTRYRHTVDLIEAPESRRIITRSDCRWDLD